MKLTAIAPALCGLILIGGCAKSEVTERDSDQVREDFSQENYEKAMQASGREQELAEEKARWAAHEASGRDSQD